MSESLESQVPASFIRLTILFLLLLTKVVVWKKIVEVYKFYTFGRGFETLVSSLYLIFFYLFIYFEKEKYNTL